MSLVNVKKQFLNKYGYKNFSEWIADDNHVYIGRNMSFYVPGAVASKWANPFTVKKYGRDECLEKYREHIMNSPLLDEISELKGKVLGCWCHPERCHGDVLLDILNKIELKSVSEEKITMSGLTVEDYSEKCIVVRGDTKPHKEQLKGLGGKWNGRLKDGGGWIFSKKYEDKVLQYVSSGKQPEPISEFSNLYTQIEKEVAKMSPEQRLQFLAQVTALTARAVNQPTKTVEKPTETSKSKIKIKIKPRKKEIESNDESMSDSDVSSDSEDEEIPRKSFLNRK